MTLSLRKYEDYLNLSENAARAVARYEYNRQIIEGHFAKVIFFGVATALLLMSYGLFNYLLYNAFTTHPAVHTAILNLLLCMPIVGGLVTWIVVSRWYYVCWQQKKLILKIKNEYAIDVEGLELMCLRMEYEASGDFLKRITK